MNNFNKNAKQTIDNLSRVFKTNIVDNNPSINSKYSIGIEIEIKFRYFFPELFKRFFENKKWNDYNVERKQEISDIILKEERIILSKLERTIACGIPRGNDKYWEFSLAPANDLSLLVKQVEILKQIGLIPKGRHSMHITIGGLKVQPRHYYILSMIELLFLDKERIKEGFSEYQDSSYAWAKKGLGGIFKKIHCDLIEQEQGFEFRTLYMDENTNLFNLFSLLNSLLSEDNEHIIMKLKREMISRGFTDENWQKPHINPEMWNKYINEFDELKRFVQREIKGDSKTSLY